jgi:hypothetical protein
MRIYHNADSAPRGWRAAVLYYFLLHAPGVVGACVLGTLLAAMLEAIAGWRVDRFLAGPIYPIQSTMGFALGLFVYSRLRSKSALLVWLLGLAWLLNDLVTSMQDGGTSEVLKFLSARNCGGCMEQLFVLCPFYASVLYSIGAAVGVAVCRVRGSAEDQIVPQSATQISSSEKLGRWQELWLFFLHFIVGVLGTGFAGPPLLALSGAVLGSRAASYLFGGPLYLGQIAMGFALGMLLYRRLQSRAAFFIWVTGLVWLVVDVMAWYRAGSLSFSHLFLAPSYVSAAYSLGAWLSYRHGCPDPARLVATPSERT